MVMWKLKIDLHYNCTWGAVAEWVRAATGQSMVRLPLRATLRFRTLAIPLTLLCQCLSDEILKAVGPSYPVSMPGEVKDPTSPHWNLQLSWTPPPTLNSPVCDNAALDAALHSVMSISRRST